jgi:hypothetical protein
MAITKYHPNPDTIRRPLPKRREVGGFTLMFTGIALVALLLPVAIIPFLPTGYPSMTNYIIGTSFLGAVILMSVLMIAVWSSHMFVAHQFRVLTIFMFCVAMSWFAFCGYRGLPDTQWMYGNVQPALSEGDLHSRLLNQITVDLGTGPYSILNPTEYTVDNLVITCRHFGPDVPGVDQADQIVSSAIFATDLEVHPYSRVYLKNGLKGIKPSSSDRTSCWVSDLYVREL